MTINDKQCRNNSLLIGNYQYVIVHFNIYKLRMLFIFIISYIEYINILNVAFSL